MRVDKSLIISVILLFLLLTTFPIESQIPDRPVADTSKYYGYEYGCAGISDVILDTIPFLDVEISNLALNMTKKCVNTLWDGRSEYMGVKQGAWTKTPNGDTIYPGAKYGAVGILETLLHYSNLTQQSIWLERVVQSYNSIMNQAINKTTRPHWAYAYTLPSDPYGIPITDLKYGSGGVLRINLDIFKENQNQTLLIEGERIISWLMETSRLVNSNGINYNVIPWYQLDGANAQIYSAYDWGLSGLAPLLYEYGVYLNSTTIKAWAMELIKFIQSIQKNDGSWPFAFEEELVSLGYDQGVAGVLHGLYEMKLLRSTSEFDDSIENGINFLFSKLIDNSTTFGFQVSNFDSSIYNNYGFGLSGILDILMELDEFLTVTQRELVAKGIEHLLTNESVTLNHQGSQIILLRQPWLEPGVFDFSKTDGLGGLLVLLTNIPESYSSLFQFDTKKAIEYIVNSFLVFQGSDGLWPKQRDLSPIIPAGVFSALKTLSSENSKAKLIYKPLLLAMILLAYRQKKTLNNI